MTNPRYKLGDTSNSLYRDLTDSDKTILRNNDVDVVKISGTDGLNAVEIQQTNPVVKIQSLNTGTTGFAALSLGVTNGDSWNLSAGVSGTGNSDPDFGFHISKNDTEIVTIRNNGNIGFGTTDPQYSLDIADSIRTQGDFHVTGNIFIDGVTGFADVDNIWYVDGSNNIISNAYSGNYGIGTDTPGYKLEVNGDVGVSGNIVPTLDSTFDLGTTTQRFRDLYLDGNTIYIGDAQISASTSTITISNDFVVGGSLSITGGVDFGDNLNISGTLGVGGSAQLNSLGVTTDASIIGNTTMTGTLDVESATQLNSLGVTTDASITGTLDVASATQLNSLGITNDASITGNTTMTGTLNVASATQLNSLGVTTDASITGNTTITGTLDVASSTQLNSLGVTTDASITGNTTMAGELAVIGNVGIGITTPQSKLDIADTEPEMRFTDTRTQVSTAGTVLGRILWNSKDNSGDGDHDVASIQVQVSNNSTIPDGDIVFSTGLEGVLTERVRITQDGNIRGNIICQSIGSLGFILLDEMSTTTLNTITYSTFVVDLDNQSTDNFAMYKIIYMGQQLQTVASSIRLRFHDTGGEMSAANGHVAEYRAYNGTLFFSGTDTSCILTHTFNAGVSTYQYSGNFELTLQTGLSNPQGRVNFIGQATTRLGNGANLVTANIQGGLTTNETISTRITGFGIQGVNTDGGDFYCRVYRML